MSRLFFSGVLIGPMVLLGTVWVLTASPASPSPSAYAEHPPVGHTGGFNEPTCHACHFGGELNAGEGELSVEGLPSGVQPGATYQLTFTLRAEMERSGFMGAVRFADGTQAGSLTPVDTSRVTVETVDSTGVQYAYHTLTGTEVSGASAEWSVEWTLPEQVSADSVVVHVSANAANGDDSEFGDDVYSIERRAAVEE